MSSEQSWDCNFGIFIFNTGELDERQWNYNLPSLPKLDIPWFVLFKVYHYLPNISIKYWVHIVVDPNFIQETSWWVGFEKQKSRIQSNFQTEELISTRKAAFETRQRIGSLRHSALSVCWTQQYLVKTKSHHTYMLGVVIPAVIWAVSAYGSGLPCSALLQSYAMGCILFQQTYCSWTI